MRAALFKKGEKSPGVQRQHCGAVGKHENCIVTVHLGYARDDFHCLIDGDLFLPEGWSSDRERCREAGVPEEVVYRPKSDIALELHARAGRQRRTLRVGHIRRVVWQQAGVSADARSPRADVRRRSA